MTDLKQIFPNSFIDFIGKRRATVTLLGKWKVINLYESISSKTISGIDNIMYNQKNNTTSFDVFIKPTAAPLY